MLQVTFNKGLFVLQDSPEALALHCRTMPHDDGQHSVLQTDMLSDRQY